MISTPESEIQLVSALRISLDPPDSPLLPCQFFERANLTLDNFGQPTVSGVIRCNNDIGMHSSIDVAFSDRIMIYHYFHFVELLLTAATVLFNARLDIIVENVYVGTQNWCNAAQNNVQRKLIEAVLRPRNIVEAIEETGPWKHSAALLLIDRYHPIDCLYNKFLEPAMSRLPKPFKLVRQRVWDAVGIEANAPRGERVIYIRRTGNRALSPEVEARLLSIFASFGVETIDFACMSWEEQVRASRSARLMIGVHGNGLTNALWMVPGSTVIELFPADFHTYDYQFYAEIAGHRYLGYEGRERGGYTYTNGARVGTYYGREDAMIEQLPWLALQHLGDALTD